MEDFGINDGMLTTDFVSSYSAALLLKLLLTCSLGTAFGVANDPLVPLLIEIMS